jgi:hypothetical protein
MGSIGIMLWAKMEKIQIISYLTHASGVNVYFPPKNFSKHTSMTSHLVGT